MIRDAATFFDDQENQSHWQPLTEITILKKSHLLNFHLFISIIKIQGEHKVFP
jgi:hypothetical protein